MINDKYILYGKFLTFPLVFIDVFWYNWKRTNVLRGNGYGGFPCKLLCDIFVMNIEQDLTVPLG